MISKQHSRLIAASVVSLIGVGAVVWTAVRLFGSAAPATSGLLLPPEEMDGPRLYEFEPAADAVENESLRASLRQSAALSGALQRFGTEAKASFADAAWAAILPSLTGSVEDYIQSSKLLGDPVERDEDLEATWRSYKKINPVVSIVSDEVVVEMFATNGQKRGLFEDGLRAMRTGFNGIQTFVSDERYQDAVKYASRSLDVVEVRCLVKMKNKGKLFDAVIGVAMAWDPVQQRWQPVEHRIYHKDDAPAIYMAPI